MSIQTSNGKAFEWAVAFAFQQNTTCQIVMDASAIIAKDFFLGLSRKQQDDFMTSALVATRHIIQRETLDKITPHGTIHFNVDRSGEDGDVRDVILTTSKKIIGISCKNNHQAMKHSRLSSDINFVQKWGLHVEGCSKQYWDRIEPIFQKLREVKEQSHGKALWSSIPDKAQKCYWPLLDAWEAEIQRIKNLGSAYEKSLCQAFISYLVGRHDHYKVMRCGEQAVEIQAWNFNKTLHGTQTKFPDRIISINNKNGGQYSKTVTFNHGYSLNFRIHNASSRVEPSLKFDIKAIGLPTNSIYQQRLDV